MNIKLPRNKYLRFICDIWNGLYMKWQPEFKSPRPIKWCDIWYYSLTDFQQGYVNHYCHDKHAPDVKDCIITDDIEGEHPQYVHCQKCAIKFHREQQYEGCYCKDD